MTKLKKTCEHLPNVPSLLGYNNSPTYDGIIITHSKVNNNTKRRKKNG